MSLAFGDALGGEASALPLRSRMENLLRRWADGVLSLQVSGLGRTELDGGVLCPACAYQHGRICDMVYPLAYLSRMTGERRYLSAAEAAIDWCEANVRLPSGLYRNDRQSTWWPTTAFFVISLGRLLRDDGNLLPSATREKWTAVFIRAAAAVYAEFEGGFDPNVNYQCAYPLAMHLAWLVTGEEKYREAAAKKAEQVLHTSFNDEGFLVGEGGVNGSWTGRTARGCQMIDLGYNLEESLASLVEYANLAGNAALRAKAVASAKVHLAFVLPDGAIDDSCGSRALKWTYYGSRTSDGILPLLALLKNDVPYAAKMAKRVTGLYERCTGADGLLRGGLMYDEAGEPPCVHHSFVRMKGLVDYLRTGDFEPKGELPREAASGVWHVRSMDTYLVALGPWRATVTANDAYNCRQMPKSVVSGGTLSMLWHAALGPVAVATPGVFFYKEPQDMQDDRHDATMRCLAPRLVAGEWSSIFETTARTQGEFRDGVFSYEAKGSDWSLEYVFSSDGLTLTADCRKRGARLAFPIVAGRDDRVEIDGRTVRVIRPRGTVTFEASVRPVVDHVDRVDRIWSPVSGLLCVPLSIPLSGSATVRVTVEERY